MDRGSSYHLPSFEEGERKSKDSEDKMRCSQGSSHDDYNQQRRTAQSDNDSFQDAVAVSSALVGEVVMDSPESSRSFLSARDILPDTPDMGFPSLGGDNENRHSTGVRPPHANPPPLAMDNTNAMSVGIMAQGFAWMRKQREERKRLLLQNEAQRQLLKIREAQLEAEEERHPQQRSLSDNPIFQNVTSSRPAPTCHPNSSTLASIDNPQTTLATNDSIELEASTTVSKSGDGISVALPSFAVYDDNDADASFIPPVRVEDAAPVSSSSGVSASASSTASTTEKSPYLLTDKEMHQMASLVLPRSIAYSKWIRLYSLARDGDSFEACLRAVKNNKQTLLVVRTTRDDILGGFAEATWESHSQGSGACYYGGPTSCLFRVDRSEEGLGKVRPYKWTGANRYMQLCDSTNKMLAFGGGGADGAFGLCIEKDFQVGSTGHCATFDNEPLASQENFEIVNVELYGFLLGQF